MCETTEDKFGFGASPAARPVRFLLAEQGQEPGEYSADGVQWASGWVSLMWADGMMETWPSWDQLVAFVEGHASDDYVLIREDCCTKAYDTADAGGEFVNCVPQDADAEPEPEPAPVELCPLFGRWVAA